jgi:hypothetical protein
MNATIRYVVKFTNAGLTRPYSPFIRITHKIEGDHGDQDVDRTTIRGVLALIRFEFVKQLRLDSKRISLGCGR